MTMKRHVVIQQSTEVIKSKKDYTAWVGAKSDEIRSTKKINEPVQANPDSLTEDQGFFHTSEDQKETQERVQKLLKIAKQVLTEQQYIVFDLIGLRCMTVRRAARVMKRSPGRVDQLWKSARHKLQKVYEERT
jgi:DNA-directed RNA polymerase specialized sigma24 family protein